MTSTRRVSLKLTLTTIVAVAGLTISAGLNMARTQAPPSDADTYGAIAYNKNTGRYGWSTNYKTQDEANDRALDECGRGCRVVMRFWGEYRGALARGDNSAWGATSGPTDEGTRRTAIETCRKYRGTNCSVLVSACNTP